jgi:hypothetical protein
MLNYLWHRWRGRKRQILPSSDFVVDERGKLVYIFWVDATSRKNYRHFGDLVSFDTTYSTNQYNMIFAPFTGVNHHMQKCVVRSCFPSK